MGTNYAVPVERHGKTLLINASAGFAPGALAGAPRRRRRAAGVDVRLPQAWQKVELFP